MEIKGKVVRVLDVETGTSKSSGKEWQKRCFVIETDGQYPKRVCLQLFGKMVGVCPAEGEVVNVSFEADSHEFNGRWYTSLNAWKVEREGGQAVPEASAAAAADEDELPF